MAKRLSILLMAALMVLSGCSDPSKQTEVFPSSGSEETCFSVEESTDERGSQQKSLPDPVQNGQDKQEAEENNDPPVMVNDPVNDEVNDSLTAEDEQMIYQTETPDQKEADSDSTLAVSESTAPPQTEPESSSFREVETSGPGESESDVPAEEPEVITPEESREPIPETEPQQEESAETESAEEADPEPVFDIDYWISYAQGLAQSKGLRLDATATECWDNPITANASCIYLERDLNARLDRYAGDEDITDVWIWYEDQGNGRYLIYIGYA